MKMTVQDYDEKMMACNKLCCCGVLELTREYSVKENVIFQSGSGHINSEKDELNGLSIFDTTHGRHFTSTLKWLWIVFKTLSSQNLFNIDSKSVPIWWEKYVWESDRGPSP